MERTGAGEGARWRPRRTRIHSAPQAWWPRDGWSTSVGLEVDGAGLAALVGLEVVADPLVLVERGQAGALDGADMDERVLAAVLGRNETETLLGIEELYFTGDHGMFLLKARRK